MVFLNLSYIKATESDDAQLRNFRRRHGRIAVVARRLSPGLRIHGVLRNVRFMRPEKLEIEP